MYVGSWRWQHAVRRTDLALRPLHRLSVAEGVQGVQGARPGQEGGGRGAGAGAVPVMTPVAVALSCEMGAIVSTRTHYTLRNK